MAAIALPLILIAFGLQGIGYTGTCTEGNNGPFLVGALFSLPFLALSAFLLAKTAARNLRLRLPNGSIFHGLAGLCVALVAIRMTFVNGAVARDTLWLGTGACGADYTPVGQFNGEDLMIGIVFAILPMLVAALACFTLWTALPTRLRGSN